MAKKRRRQNRPRNQAARTGGTRTAERPNAGARTDRRASTETEPTERPQATKTGAGSQRSRAEKKDLARKEREAARRRVARARRNRQILRVGVAAVILGVGAFLLFRPDEPTTPTGPLPGELTTEAPWPANAEQAAERAEILGIPGHSQPLAMHEHANVQIFIHGEQQPIPVNIGIDEATGAIQSIHTHEGSGTVHIESETATEFTLGQFFGVWGVRLTPSCIGGSCNDDENRIRVYVDGEEVTTDPRDVPLDDQTVIVITYGTAEEEPDPIPSSFDFSSIQP